MFRSRLGCVHSLGLFASILHYLLAVAPGAWTSEVTEDTELIFSVRLGWTTLTAGFSDMCASNQPLPTDVLDDTRMPAYFSRRESAASLCPTALLFFPFDVSLE
jgi:hypothetical protein